MKISLLVILAGIAASTMPSFILAQQPLAPARSEATSEAPEIAGLLGGYEAAPGRILTIMLVQDTLYGETSTGDRKKLTHQSGATYAVDGTGMLLTFTLGADRRATALVLRQGGNERTLPKIR